MEKQIADILDTALLIIIIAIALRLGGTSLAADYKELSQYKIENNDKTAPSKYTPSYKTYGEYDGSLTQADVILMSQIQDFEATKVSSFKYEDFNVNVVSTYRTNLNTYANNIWAQIGDDDSNSKYKYVYHYNYDENDDKEEYFAIEKED